MAAAIIRQLECITEPTGLWALLYFSGFCLGPSLVFLGLPWLPLGLWPWALPWPSPGSPWSSLSLLIGFWALGRQLASGPSLPWALLVVSLGPSWAFLGPPCSLLGPAGASFLGQGVAKTNTAVLGPCGPSLCLPWVLWALGLLGFSWAFPCKGPPGPSLGKHNHTPFANASPSQQLPAFSLQTQVLWALCCCFPIAPRHNNSTVQMLVQFFKMTCSLADRAATN